jgi:hypothetical protein
MRAREYTPTTPLHTAPGGTYVTPGQRADALSDALRGVELGAYDEQIAAWMVRVLDDPTVRTIVSLLERVRAQGMLEVLEVEKELWRRRVEASRGPGNTGPGR